MRLFILVHLCVCLTQAGAHSAVYQSVLQNIPSYRVTVPKSLSSSIFVSKCVSLERRITAAIVRFQNWHHTGLEIGPLRLLGN